MLEGKSKHVPRFTAASLIEFINTDSCVVGCNQGEINLVLTLDRKRKNLKASFLGDSGHIKTAQNVLEIRQ